MLENSDKLSQKDLEVIKKVVPLHSHLKKRVSRKLRVLTEYWSESEEN